MTKVSQIKKQEQYTHSKQTKAKLIKVEKCPDFEVRTYETNGSAGKKFGAGFASLGISGLGQVVNGQFGKATGFCLASLASIGTCIWGEAKDFKSHQKYYKEMYRKYGKPNMFITFAPPPRNKVAEAMMIGGIIGFFGVKLLSIVDAAICAKTKIDRIVPRSEVSKKN